MSKLKTIFMGTPDDETIQLFSPGRSSQVTDVWIDFAGVVTGTLLAFLVQAIVRRCKK